MAGPDENPRLSALFLAICVAHAPVRCGSFAAPIRRGSGGSLQFPFICNCAVSVPSQIAMNLLHSFHD